MNVLDHHLSPLIQRAEALEAEVAAGLSTVEGESELNKLNAYWTQIRDLAVGQQVVLLNYDTGITQLERSLVRCRARLGEQVNQRSFWSRFVDFARAVLDFLGFRSASRLLGAAQRLALPAASGSR